MSSNAAEGIKNCSSSIGPWPVEANPGQFVEVEDVVNIKTQRDGSQLISFDPSRAADAVINALYLKTTNDDKRIWCYQGGVFAPKGEDVVNSILDRLAGNFYSIHSSKEVMAKIRARTLCSPLIFDAKPNVFGVANGAIDLETCAFSEYSPELLITLKSPVKYNKDAKCPRFLKFLWSSLGNIDDVITVIDMMVAMATTSTWEYFVAMIGPGSNGKSVLEQVISAFFGQAQVTEVELAELNSNQFIRAAIKGKRALINSEVQGTKMESRWIKIISGGTALDSDLKNRDRIHFKPHCLIIIDTNKPPQFYDNSYGFQRRFIKLDFRYSFVDNPEEGNAWERQRDPALFEALTSEEEMSGILNLIILRSKDIIKTRTIHRRTEGSALTDEYDRQSHSLSAHFNDCYSVQEEDGWKLFTSFDIVRERYETYCQAINAAPESDRSLAFYIKNTLNCKADRDYVYGPNSEKKRVRGYYGLFFEKENFELLVKSNVPILGTDILSMGQIGTDNGTDKEATRDTRTDKS
jgi:P4 family phage/plasmid primase-like protien